MPKQGLSDFVLYVAQCSIGVEMTYKYEGVFSEFYCVNVIYRDEEPEVMLALAGPESSSTIIFVRCSVRLLRRNTAFSRSP